MTTKSKNLLWRVEWVHRNGYQAPTYYVECKRRKEAIELAKGRSRLASFPKVWFARVIKEQDELDPVWY